MKNYILFATFLLGFNSIANAVMMAPWTRSAMAFNQVLEYLNENSLQVISIAYSENDGNKINASVFCSRRSTTTLVFDVNNLARETKISLNANLSGKCL